VIDIYKVLDGDLVVVDTRDFNISDYEMFDGGKNRKRKKS